MIQIAYEFDKLDSKIKFMFQTEPRELEISYASDVELSEFVRRLIELMEKEETIDLHCGTHDKSEKEKIISETIEGIVEKFNQVIEGVRSGD